LSFQFSSLVKASPLPLPFGSAVQRVIAGCSFRALGRGIPLERCYFPASLRGLPSVSISLVIESSLAYIVERDAASRSNQALERTAARRMFTFQDDYDSFDSSHARSRRRSLSFVSLGLMNVSLIFEVSSNSDIGLTACCSAVSSTWCRRLILVRGSIEKPPHSDNIYVRKYYMRAY
jgi:hypothetical protein